MTDTLLWKQLKEGDKTALETIYRTYVKDLLRYGNKFSEDEQLVEDCIQDLFIELWKNRTGLGETNSINRYLLVALRRKIIRQITRKGKIQLSESTQDYDFNVEIGMDEQLIAKELSEAQRLRMQQALEQLSKRQKEAIYLKYQMGLDYDGICEAMSISYQSARNLISTALKQLKDLIGSNLTLVLFLLKV
jgi:RNA polymerase sigma factor (sigma-70 family)